jgi:opacity protein-like surface antigen
MNHKTWCLNIFAALLCLSSACASASEPGFYVTGSLGTGDEDPKSDGTNIATSLFIFRIDPDQVTVDDGDLAWSVGLGYRVNKYLSGELEYIDFGTTNVAEHYTVDAPGQSFPGPAEFTLNYSSNVTGPALSLLGTLPVGENFELFLRGGALFGSRDYAVKQGALDEKFSRTVWLAGAGVTWSFATRWAIRAEYQQTGTLSESIVSGETQLKRISLSALFKL